MVYRPQEKFKLQMLVVEFQGIFFRIVRPLYVRINGYLRGYF